MSKSFDAYRHYPVSLGQRIRFIKRAQRLCFSLEEISELLLLEGGKGRTAIRRIAEDRLRGIQTKLADLSRMQDALLRLIDTCKRTGKQLPHPIISTLTLNPS